MYRTEYAHAKLELSCARNAVLFAMADAAIASSKGVCSKKSCANAHAVFANSCTTVASRISRSEAAAIASRPGVAPNPKTEFAHAVFLRSSRRV